MAFYEGTGTWADRNFVISFSRNPRYDFGVFARGYGRAASALAEALLARNSFADYDAYPVVFLYRHALELYLKHVIYQTALLMGFRGIENIDTKLQNTHDLMLLAERATAILRGSFPEDASLGQVLDEIKTISSEFTKLDSNSYAYRYPIDRTGEPSTGRHQTVSLAALHANMGSLLEKMDVIGFGIDTETFRAQEIAEILDML